MGEKKINNMNYSHNNYSKKTGEPTRKIKNSHITLKSKEEKFVLVAIKKIILRIITVNFVEMNFMK